MEAYSEPGPNYVGGWTQVDIVPVGTSVCQWGAWLRSECWDDQGLPAVTAVTTVGRMDGQSWVLKQKVWAPY